MPLADGDQYEDLLAKLGVKTLLFQMDAAGSRVVWFADRDGREYADSGAESGMLQMNVVGPIRVVRDGTKSYAWYSGDPLPWVSKWRFNNPVSGPAMARQWMRIEQQVADLKKTGDDVVWGKPATVYEGRLTPLNNAPTKIWKDAQGRIVKCEIRGLFVFSFGYDLPSDSKWFAVPDDQKKQAKDADAGQPAIERMTARPAVLETSDGLRTVRVPELLAGEDGMVYVALSTSLDPKAAELVRSAPYGDRWGRGYIQTRGSEDFDPYTPACVAQIKAPDRSMQWWVLIPRPNGPKGPWHLTMEMTPGTPDCLPALAKAGFTGLGRVDLELPEISTLKKTTLEDWLRRAYADTRAYGANLPPVPEDRLRPSQGTAQLFLNKTRQSLKQLQDNPNGSRILDTN